MSTLRITVVQLPIAHATTLRTRYRDPTAPYLILFLIGSKTGCSTDLKIDSAETPTKYEQHDSIFKTNYRMLID